MRRILFLFFLLPFISASAQDLTGIWRGHFKSDNFSRLMDSLNIEDKYKFETQINQNDKGFEGVTYSYKTTVFYGKASCVGAISTKTKKVMLTENRLLEVKSADGGACLMTCFLQYSKVGDEEFLEGTYSSISVRDSTQCGGGRVFLRKVVTSDFYKEPFLVEKEKENRNAPVTKVNPPAQAPKKKITPPAKKTVPVTSAPKKDIASARKPKNVAAPDKRASDSSSNPKNKELKNLPLDSFEKDIPEVMAPVPVPRVLASRKNELVQTITTAAEEVTIKIYDNGTIDNDTVSVYINNKLVISRQRLTEKPITVKINLDNKLPYHELVMVADNLGEIPPNTSLMVVNAGSEQYEVRITSTEQKNAMVRFRRE